MIDNNPLISVIMNCYNGEKYLKSPFKVYLISLILIGSLFFGIIYQQIKVQKLLRSLIIKKSNII